MPANTADESEKIIKIRLTEAEQTMVRVAAAMDNISMAEFGKRAALQAAQDRMETFASPGLAASVKKAARARKKT